MEFSLSGGWNTGVVYIPVNFMVNVLVIFVLTSGIVIKLGDKVLVPEFGSRNGDEKIGTLLQFAQFAGTAPMCSFLRFHVGCLLVFQVPHY